jgi:hypothetical protein
VFRLNCAVLLFSTLVAVTNVLRMCIRSYTYVCADCSLYALHVLLYVRAGGAVERRKFPNSGDYMDWFNGSYYRNGFSFKEVRTSKLHTSKYCNVLTQVARYTAACTLCAVVYAVCTLSLRSICVNFV